MTCTCCCKECTCEPCLYAFHLFFAFHNMTNQIYRIQLFINNKLNIQLYFVKKYCKKLNGKILRMCFIISTAQSARDRTMKHHFGTYDSFVSTFPFSIPSKLSQRFTSPRTRHIHEYFIFKLTQFTVQAYESYRLTFSFSSLLLYFNERS